MSTARNPDMPEDEFNHTEQVPEEFWGEDGVTLRGDIRVTGSVPTTIDGLTIYGNAEASGAKHVSFKDLWVKKGGREMAGNVSVKNVGAANVADNTIAGDVAVDTVGVLNLVRNHVGGPGRTAIDHLVIVCENRATIDDLKEIDARIDELRRITELAERSQPGSSARLMQVLKAAIVSQGIRTLTDAVEAGLGKLYSNIESWFSA